MIPHLPQSLLGQALAAAQAIRDEWARAKVLTALAPHLPEAQRAKVLDRALVAAQAIGDEWARVKALAALAPPLSELPITNLYPLWCKTLHELAHRKRGDLLSYISHLVPVIVALASKTAIEETFHAIRDVGQWWP